MDGSKGGAGMCKVTGEVGEVTSVCGKRGDRGSYWRRSKDKLKGKESCFMFVVRFSCTVSKVLGGERCGGWQQKRRLGWMNREGL